MAVRCSEGIGRSFREIAVCIENSSWPRYDRIDDRELQEQ